MATTNENKLTEKSVILTPHFRLGYNSLFNPKVVKERGDDGEEVEKKEWTITMIFDKDADLTQMKELAALVKKAKWGDKKPVNYKTAFVKGENRPKEDGTLREEYTDKIVMYAKNKFEAPRVYDMDRNEILPHEKSKIYSGCWCVAMVNAYAWKHSGNTGVSLGLKHVMKVGDDSHFASDSDPTNIFAKVQTRHVAPAADEDEGEDEY